MPKIKTHKGTKRRFHVTATGKILRRKGNISHNRMKKAPRAKRRLDEMVEVHPSARQRLRRLLPYGSR